MKINEKKILIIIVVLCICGMIGGTYAYAKWRTSEAQKTEVTFTLEQDFTCAADGGGNITSADVMLAPAKCTNTKHAIKRELTAKPTLFGSMNLYMDLWLEIDSLDPELAASPNFKYVLSTNANSCENGVITSGTFSELTVGDTIPLLTQKEYMETQNDKYYLYVWLDKEETSTSTMNKNFSLSINGHCENADKTSYVMYSPEDNSLRFYKSNNVPSDSGTGASQMANMLIEDETTENTATYIDIENTKYNSPEAVPWHEYRDSITTVIVEEPISPKSIKYWFNGMTNVTYMDLSKLDTSRVTDMGSVFEGTGKSSSTFLIDGLENWDTSNVTDMTYMFCNVGENATTFDIGNIGNFDVSNVKNIYRMFYKTGRNAMIFDIGDLSNWNISNVTSTWQLFNYAGQNATTWNIGDLSKWDLLNVTNINGMFESAGSAATTFNIGNIGNWDVSNVTDMGGLFRDTGKNATTFNIGDLSYWDVSNVENVKNMFEYAGSAATTFNIGNLNNWDVSNVTDMTYMFYHAGQKATTWNIGDLSKWDVSNVTTMFYMFAYTGQNATEWNIGDLSKWDVSNVTSMFGVFREVGQNATTFNIGNLNNWDVSNVTDMSSMFASAGQNATYSLDLSGWNVDKVTSYGDFNRDVGNKIIPPTWVN